MQKELIAEMAEMEKSYWWHVAKRRLVVQSVTRLMLGRKGAKPRILDAGCGTGGMLADLELAGAKPSGADTSADALSFARLKSGAELKRIDFNRRLPYRSESFDGIICADVLEHVAKERFLLSEFWRILKPGGFVFITVPAYMFLWSYWDKQLRHQRRYTGVSLRKSLESAGFSVQKSSYYFSFLLPVGVVVRFFKEKLGDHSSDFLKVPTWLNWLLLRLSLLEQTLADFVSIPFGLSVFAAAKKN